jgi:hypothetical protein
MGNKEIIYIFGNHEWRFDRFIMNHARPFWNIVTLQKELQLDQLDIKYVPYNERYEIEDSKLGVMHSPSSYGKSGTMTNLENDMASTIYGCTHREQKSTKVTKHGIKYYCFFNGWLGDKKYKKQNKLAFRWTKGHANWQHCFSIVTTINRTHSIVNQISIDDIDGKFYCVVDGNLYEAS